MSKENVIEVNDLNFDAEVLASDRPVLVDFTATWCGPCKLLAPILEKLADDRLGTLKVAKIDIDDAPVTAARYGVRAAPTMLLFVGGEKRRSHVGLTTRAKLEKLVE